MAIRGSEIDGDDKIELTAAEDILKEVDDRLELELGDPDL